MGTLQIQKKSSDKDESAIKEPESEIFSEEWEMASDDDLNSGDFEYE